MHISFILRFSPLETRVYFRVNAHLDHRVEIVQDCLKLFSQTQEYHVLDDLLIQHQVQQRRGVDLVVKLGDLQDRVSGCKVCCPLCLPAAAEPDVLSFRYIGESSSSRSSSLAESSASSRHSSSSCRAVAINKFKQELQSN